MLQGFEELDCWKACRRLRMHIVFAVAPQLPDEERFRLADQMVRAARSATANLAEGYGRDYALENVKFCSQARGSCQEVLDHLITAYDEQMIPEDVLQESRELAVNAMRLIAGYMRYLKNARHSGELHEPSASYGCPVATYSTTSNRQLTTNN